MLRGASSGGELSGTDNDKANGFSVNSVARGDINASSIPVNARPGAFRCGSDASISACKL